MYLSAREKEVIAKIASNEIHDLLSYVLEMGGMIEGVNTEQSNFVTRNGDTIRPGAAVKIVKDEKRLLQELISFIALCKKLQNYQLLHIYENATHKQIPPILMRYPDGKLNIPSSLWDFLAKEMRLEIVTFNELLQFIESGFLTAEDINLKEERAARVTAQRTTIVVAVAGLFISTVTSVGIAYFNYKTYSTERKVFISNLDAVKYPIPILITEPTQMGGVASRTDIPKHQSKEHSAKSR